MFSATLSPSISCCPHDATNDSKNAIQPCNTSPSRNTFKLIIAELNRLGSLKLQKIFLTDIKAGIARHCNDNIKICRSFELLLKPRIRHEPGKQA